MPLASLLTLLALGASPVEPLGPGNHTRTLEVDGRTRSYLVHVPKSLDLKKPAPVVLALHGAGMNAGLMAAYSGMSKKADQAGFVVVYPDGTGAGKALLTWNAGPFRTDSKDRPDDVAFLRKLLDDLGTVVKVDSRRVYATGLSNGGMMTYRLAAEMSDRLTAVAPVAGTLTLAKVEPKRPVPLLHIHGTADPLVPYTGPRSSKMAFRGVEDSVKTWAKAVGCRDEPSVADLVDKSGEDLKMRRTTWGGGKDGAEVVLITIEGGGHVWPGQALPVEFLGKNVPGLKANDVIWEFFRKHARKEK